MEQITSLDTAALDAIEADARAGRLSRPRNVAALIAEVRESRAEREGERAHLEDGARELARRINRDERPTPTDWSWLMHENERARKAKRDGE